MQILAATKVPNEIAARKRCCKRSGSACPSWISVTYPAWIFAANAESMQDTVLFPGIHQAYITMSGRFDVHKAHMKLACKPSTYWQ